MKREIKSFQFEMQILALHYAKALIFFSNTFISHLNLHQKSARQKILLSYAVALLEVKNFC